MTNYGVLAMAAEVVDDLERVRIGNQNRLRQFVRPCDQLDESGKARGFGFDESHPDVARLAVLVDTLVSAEKQAIGNLERMMEAHPFGPWVLSTKGAGLKTVARLLAATGDPYWHGGENRPRLVSELWSYAGYGDAAAQVRRKGTKSNWSPTAKMRTYLVSKAIVMSGGPLKDTYNEAKANYAEAVHTVECARCTGKRQPPAPVGSPLKPAHIDARGYRALSKEVLRQLWLESRRLHLAGSDQVPALAEAA